MRVLTLAERRALDGVEARRDLGDGNFVDLLAFLVGFSATTRSAMRRRAIRVPPFFS